jgi:D-serine deaminase-like pyridoxal phosphate-dependent protein
VPAEEVTVVIDAAAVAALDEEILDWRFKAISPATPVSAREFVAAGFALSALGTPLLTLAENALSHNIAAMAAWTAEAGLVLAPHGKTTMAPQLWQRQLAAGAWGITLANLPQLRVARAFGVQRLMLANSLVDPAGLAWIAGQLDADPGFEFLCWADSVRTVELMDSALRASGGRRPVGVCTELGAPGGRTGARDTDGALAVAAAIGRAPTLRLAGVAGYEGALAHDPSARSLATVDAYLHELAALHRKLDYQVAEPIVTAGGSAYFDRVAAILGGLAAGTTGPGATVVVRAGAYAIHDDGFYRGISPFSRGTGHGPLRSAMHGWARVVSRPERALALLDAGKRDLPFDEGLPEPQAVRGGGPLTGAQVTALNDQHTFLRVTGDKPEIGDVVRLGLSHPCTAMDKWQLVPVVEDAETADPVVSGLIRTFF